MDESTYLSSFGTSEVSKESLKSAKIVAMFFSAHWAPPCRGFTPVLEDFYEIVNKVEK